MQATLDLTTGRPSVADRIESERAYHARHYATVPPLAVNFDLSQAKVRRPWNLTWAYYDTIRRLFNGHLSGVRILAAGCGTGLVALNLAAAGALVDAFDLSQDAIAICRKRAAFNGIANVHFFTSAFEELDVADGAYDAVVGEMILHHVDVPIATDKMHALLKQGGVGVFAEWKKYAVVDVIRSLTVFRTILPPGGVSHYATEFERKLDSNDLRTLQTRFPDLHFEYRYCFRGKLDYFLPWSGRFEKLDFLLLRLFPFLSPFSDAVIISFAKR